jgi:hypothetical protein
MATTGHSIRQCDTARVGSVGGKNADAAGYARWQARLKRLVAMPEGELATHDIARLNLFCAAGLPRTEGIDPDACIARLEDWTKYISRNIERWWPDFLKSPREGEDSPGKFCMMAIASLLQVQLRVHYNLPFTEGDYDGRDSRNLFLHGLLSGHGGTCVTLPVLYLAVGRRLGYPLFLVKTSDHYFIRWDEPGAERFNVECAVRGFASFSDQHYQTWKTPITDREVQTGVFLRNLTRREELAHFLVERGNCLLDHLRTAEALEAYYHACQIAPHDGGIRGNWLVASIMHRTLQSAMRETNYEATQTISVAGMRYPEPRDANEAWAIPRARETFARIFRIWEKPVASMAPS